MDWRLLALREQTGQAIAEQTLLLGEMLEHGTDLVRGIHQQAQEDFVTDGARRAGAAVSSLEQESKRVKTAGVAFSGARIALPP